MGGVLKKIFSAEKADLNLSGKKDKRSGISLNCLSYIFRKKSMHLILSLEYSYLLEIIV